MARRRRQDFNGRRGRKFNSRERQDFTGRGPMGRAENHPIYSGFFSLLFHSSSSFFLCPFYCFYCFSFYCYFFLPLRHRECDMEALGRSAPGPPCLVGYGVRPKSPVCLATRDKGEVRSRAGPAWAWEECSSRPAPTRGLGQIDGCPALAKGQGLGAGVDVRAHPGPPGGVRDGVRGARGPH